MAADPQDAPRHAGQVVRACLYLESFGNPRAAPERGSGSARFPPEGRDRRWHR